METKEIRERLSSEIELREKIDEGLNEVFRVSYRSRNGILKLHTEKKDENFFHDYEAIALKEINKKTDIPVPEVFFFSEIDEPSYFIMEEVNGINGKEIVNQTSFEEKKQLIREFGEHLNQLHSSMKFKQFGYLRRKDDQIETWKSFDSWKELLLHHLRRDLEALESSRFENLQKRSSEFIRDKKDLLDEEFEPVLIHDDNRYSNLIYEESLETVLDWATGYNGEPRYDLVKAEFLLIDYELESLSSEKRDELRDALYSGYGFDMRGKELRQLYLLASAIWTMKGYQNWSERLESSEREEVAQRISSEVEKILD